MLKGRIFAVSLFAMLMAGCAPSVQEYTGQKPAFVVSEFFDGELKAVGIVQDYRGKVTRRFEADIRGRWEGNKGVLDEHFRFDDGEQQWRCWQLQLDGDQLVGTAGDVIGEAQGRISGNTLNWKYVLEVPMEEGKTIEVTLDDWLYLVSNDHLINRTAMRKYGLPVGEVTLAIHRLGGPTDEETRPSCRISGGASAGASL